MGQLARILTEAERGEVETLAAVLSSAQIADYLGMGRRTFYDAIARDADLAARYKRGRARAVGAVAQSLIAKARGGHVTAMIFFLKTQGGWRETDRLELSGSAGGPVRMEVADTTERDGDEVFKHLKGLMDSVEPQSAAAKKLDGFLQYLIQSNASHEAAG